MSRKCEYFVGVTTAPRESPTLQATLASIRLAGWNVDLLANDEHKSLGPYGNFLRVLQAGVACATHATTHATDHILVFQDDIEVTRGLRSCLDANQPPVGVVSLYTPANLHRDESGWHKTTRLPRSYGALAIMMDCEMAAKFIASPPGRETGGKLTWRNTHQTDFWITKFCAAKQIPYWTHSPSFTMHAGTTSSLDSPNANSRVRQCYVFCRSVAAENTGNV